MFLSKHKKETIRSIAVGALLDAKGDEELAKHLARERIPTHAEFNSIITMFLIGLAVQLAIRLIMYWINKKITPKLGSFEPGEPDE